jgi:hypothetical protein
MDQSPANVGIVATPRPALRNRYLANPSCGEMVLSSNVRFGMAVRLRTSSSNFAAMPSLDVGSVPRRKNLPRLTRRQADARKSRVQLIGGHVFQKDGHGVAH